MGVDEYLTARENAKRVNATIVQTFAKASVALVDSLIDTSTGLVNHDHLKDANKRKNAIDKYFGTLTEQAKEYFGMNKPNAPQLPSDRLEQLIFAYSGLGREVIADYLDNARETADFTAMHQQVVLGNQSVRVNMNRNRISPRNKITEADAQAVVVKVAPGKIDHTKLRIDDMVELLEEFAENGVITDRFLEKKPYRV